MQQHSLIYLVSPTVSNFQSLTSLEVTYPTVEPRHGRHRTEEMMRTSLHSIPNALVVLSPIRSFHIRLESMSDLERKIFFDEVWPDIMGVSSDTSSLTLSCIEIDVRDTLKNIYNGLSCGRHPQKLAVYLHSDDPNVLDLCDLAPPGLPG